VNTKKNIKNAYASHWTFLILHVSALMTPVGSMLGVLLTVSFLQVLGNFWLISKDRISQDSNTIKDQQLQLGHFPNH
jgi:hypothetical protein